MIPRQFKRSPLRTLQELCEDFNVTPQKMGRLLAERAASAPKPAFVRHGQARATWYNVAEFTAWWKSLGATKQ